MLNRKITEFEAAAAKDAQELLRLVQLDLPEVCAPPQTPSLAWRSKSSAAPSFDSGSTTSTI
eukprot:890933-Pyramimonas_sp.AAC.1